MISTGGVWFLSEAYLSIPHHDTMPFHLHYSSWNTKQPWGWKRYHAEASLRIPGGQLLTSCHRGVSQVATRLEPASQWRDRPKHYHHPVPGGSSSSCMWRLLCPSSRNDLWWIQSKTILHIYFHIIDGHMREESPCRRVWLIDVVLF